MREGEVFDLEAFLPYKLNQAAEAISRDFQAIYRSSYGLTRTQWRVMTHLGKFAALTAAEICRLSHTEKTKVSRAVAGLEGMGFLSRAPSAVDRRTEILSLTERGLAAYADLGARALAYDQALRAALNEPSGAALDQLLERLIRQGDQAQDISD